MEIKEYPRDMEQMFLDPWYRHPKIKPNPRCSLLLPRGIKGSDIMDYGDPQEIPTLIEDMREYDPQRRKWRLSAQYIPVLGEERIHLPEDVSESVSNLYRLNVFEVHRITGKQRDLPVTFSGVSERHDLKKPRINVKISPDYKNPESMRHDIYYANGDFSLRVWIKMDDGDFIMVYPTDAAILENLM